MIIDRFYDSRSLIISMVCQNDPKKRLRKLC